MCIAYCDLLFGARERVAADHLEALGEGFQSCSAIGDIGVAAVLIINQEA